MISYTDFRRLLTDATECCTLDDYITECGGSVPLDNVEDVLQILSTIWEIGRDGLTIKSLSSACDIPARQIALRYGLPTRTVEGWSSGVRVPPKWQLPLIAYAVMTDFVAETK